MARRGDRRPESGAAAVEFAILFPVFIMLVMGTVTFGFAFESWINVTQAARETSRFGATFPFSSATGGNVDGWLDDLGKAAADNANIQLTGVDADDPTSYFICVGFVNKDVTGTPASKFRTWGTLRTASTSCAGSALPDNRVEVLISKPVSINWVFAENSLQVSGENISRYEPEIAP